MRKITVGVAALAGAVVSAGAVLATNRRVRAALHRRRERLVRGLHYRLGLMRGLRYRVQRRSPEWDVTDDVLADRIRSALGPLEAEIDIPHVHVMVRDHVAVLHGDVATAGSATQIVEAVAGVTGVTGVESHLHVGLLPGDTRPSDGGYDQQPSEALRRLVAAVAGVGVHRRRADSAVRAVLAVFLDRLPAGERDHVLAHLPADVRDLVADVPTTGARDARPRTVDELVERAVAMDGIPPELGDPVVRAVVATLRDLVPEEARDVQAVLPAKLRPLWA